MDFDELLQEIGPYGTYQKLVLWFVLLPGTFPCGFNAYNQIFMSSLPEHWCKVPELENPRWNLSTEVIRNISIPFNHLTQTFSKCERFNINFTEFPLKKNANESLGPPIAAGTVKCDRGWHYQLDEYSTTIVADFDLVCDRSFNPTLGLVLFGVSGLIGSYVSGIIQDGLGRRPCFFIYLILLCLFGMPTAYAPSFGWWLACRIGVGFTIPAVMGTPFLLAIELVGPAHRTYTMVLMNVAYSFSLIILAIVVYFVQIWSQLALATIIPFLAFFGFWWILPESPRWLLAVGRIDEAYEVIATMARVNKRPLKKDYYLWLKNKYLEEQKKQPKDMGYHVEKTYGVFDLFKTPNLRQKTLIITFIWFANTAVYVGLTYYAPSIGGDAYLSFFLAGAAELPTYLFLWPSMEFWGRRWTICFSMILGGSACIATILARHNSLMTLVLYCVGKFGISASFVVLPLLASELYPTVVRGVGIGLSVTVSMIGPIVIPLINYLGMEILVLPLIIMGILLVSAGILSLLLPETLQQHLPQTIEEGEEFGKRMTVVDYCNCCPRKRLKKQLKYSKKRLEDHFEKNVEDAEILHSSADDFVGDFNDSYSSLRRNSFLKAQSEEMILNQKNKMRKEELIIIKNNDKSKMESKSDVKKNIAEKEILLSGHKVTNV